ncbi:MAG: allantoicase [Cyanobacteriota bacterium]
MHANLPVASFAGLIDLAAEKVGGKALLASDEFFAEKENLLKSGRGIFIPDKYTENGKWMDGWESRRKRVAGYDWCVIKLGIPGFIKGVDIDTNYFLGNHPPYASLEACYSETDIDLDNLDKLNWVEILSKSPLNPGSQNLFTVNENNKPWTHLRLNIFPDGGVARLKVYGNVFKNWTENSKEIIDLAALTNGARVILANDMFFGSKDNLIGPGRSSNMGDGWETKRKRIMNAPDWAIVKLAKAGEIKKILVDTNHFKGNYPDVCWLEGCYQPDLDDNEFLTANIEWTEILPKTKLEAHKEHFYESEIKTDKTFTHVRLNIFPDGGISRLRLFGF